MRRAALLATATLWIAARSSLALADPGPGALTTPAPTDEAKSGFMLGPAVGYLSVLAAVQGGPLLTSSGAMIGATAGYRFGAHSFLGAVFQHGLFVPRDSAATIDTNYLGLTYRYLPKSVGFIPALSAGYRTVSTSGPCDAGSDVLQKCPTASFLEIGLGLGLRLAVTDWLLLVPEATVSASKNSDGPYLLFGLVVTALFDLSASTHP